MKYVLLVFTLATVVSIAGCSKDEKPADPVTTTVVEPPAPTTTVAPPAVEDYCKAEAMEFSCMSAVYFYGKSCPNDGPVYVKDLAQMQELVRKSGQSVTITMKDGKFLEFGVGMSMPCKQL